jgi:hypothetical protein
VEAAIPRLAKLVARLRSVEDPTLAAQAALLQYTQLLLEEVERELRATVTGRTVDGADRYAAALEVMASVERRFKGLWGSVDLPIIHGFHDAAAVTQS